MGVFYLQNVLGGLAYAGLLFMIAAGFTLIFGLMRVVNIAQTAFYLVGTYVGLTLVQRGVNFFVAGLAAGLVVALLGLIIYPLLLHRYLKHELTIVLITIGLGVMLADASLAIWGGDPKSVPPPPFLARSMVIGDLVFPAYWLALIIIAAGVAALLWAFQRYTLLGAIIRAGVDDGEMLRALGVNVDHAFHFVFVLGAFLAGLGGLLGGPITAVYPGLDLELLPLAFAVVIVGGLGSLTGAYVGSLLVGVVSTMSKAMYPEFSYFAIFVPVAIIMALRPQGLFGRR